MVHTDRQQKGMLIRAEVAIEGYEFLQPNVICIFGENGKHEGEERGLEDQRVAHFFVDLLVGGLEEPFFDDGCE